MGERRLLPQPVGMLLRIGVTCLLVNLAWIWFRADTAADGWLLFSRLFTGWGGLLQPEQWPWVLQYRYEGLMAFLICLAVVFVLECFEIVLRDRPFEEFLESLPAAVRWLVLTGLTLALLNGGLTGEIPFIYFQF